MALHVCLLLLYEVGSQRGTVSRLDSPGHFQVVSETWLCWLHKIAV